MVSSLTRAVTNIDLSFRSGHYRPPAANFRAFVHSLKEAGVDMSRVSISKSYAVLVGIEGYTKTKRKVKSAGESIVHGKNKALHPEKVRQEEAEKRDKSQSAEKERQYLQKLREEELAQERGLTDRMRDGLRLRSGEPIPRDPSSPVKDTPTEGRGVPGTGPEDGVPPPEGHR